MTEHQRFRATIWLMAAASIAFMAMSIATSWAHEATNIQGQPLGWKYAALCCSDRDCKPIESTDVKELPEGYQLVSTGEIIPYQDKRVKESPDGLFHVCQQGGNFDTGRVLCLYAPGRGY